MAVGGTTPLSNKRNREKPGNGPLGWPSDEYIQLSGGAAAAGAAAGAVAGAVAIASGLQRCRFVRSCKRAINADARACYNQRYAAVPSARLKLWASITR